MPEQVLVVPRTELFVAEEAGFSGVQQDGVDGYLERIARCGRFAPRDDVEEDPSLQQIIPYGMVCFDDPGDGAHVFLMRRTRGGNESRLHDRYSIGVGGHINPVDGLSSRTDSAVVADPASVTDSGSSPREDLVRAALERELAEELHVDTSYSVSCIGVLNDDSNAVGEVHFGVVYRIDVAGPEVRVRETDQLEGHFVPFAELSDYDERLESWSRHLLFALEPSE
jgi:predicted NUDIX family phosphoesterase